MLFLLFPTDEYKHFSKMFSFTFVVVYTLSTFVHLVSSDFRFSVRLTSETGSPFVFKFIATLLTSKFFFRELRTPSVEKEGLLYPR